MCAAGIRDLLQSGLVWVAEQSEEEIRNRAESDANHDPLPEIASREKLLCIPFGVPAIDRVLPQGGISAGALHEFHTTTQHRTVLPLTIVSYLAAQTIGRFEEAGCLGKRFILWIGEQLWPSPYGLLQQKESLLDRSLFIRARSEQETVWAFETALRSQAVAAVIVSIGTTVTCSPAVQRRLFLCARSNLTTAFVLNESPECKQAVPTASVSHWRCDPICVPGDTPAWELQLLRLKGRRIPSEACSWILECAYDRFSKVSLRVSSGMVDRSISGSLHQRAARGPETTDSSRSTNWSAVHRTKAFS